MVAVLLFTADGTNHLNIIGHVQFFLHNGERGQEKHQLRLTKAAQHTDPPPPHPQKTVLQRKTSNFGLNVHLHNTESDSHIKLKSQS